MRSVHPTTFAELLKRYRLRAPLTQEELAVRAGLSQRSIRDLERGLKHAPRMVTVRLHRQSIRAPAFTVRRGLVRECFAPADRQSPLRSLRALR